MIAGELADIEKRKRKERKGDPSVGWRKEGERWREKRRRRAGGLSGIKGALFSRSD